jgi:hypothetical protein
MWATSSSSGQGPTGPRRAPGSEDACRCQETVARAMPHTRQTRARPYGLPGAGEGAWLLVSTSAAVQGGRSRIAQVAHATAPLPWWLHPAFRAGGQSHSHGYRAVVVSSPLGRRRETPHATPQYGRRGSRTHVTADRALPRAADVTRPRSSCGQTTAGASSTHWCSPLQSLCELLARGDQGGGTKTLSLYKSALPPSGRGCAVMYICVLNSSASAVPLQSLCIKA